ncbi:MAG: DUF3526 domain-containing protein [Xanthomonadales bacterium]|nr:DUF3526 domain-containing protein [Xanthomonadales bacterium]
MSAKASILRETRFLARDRVFGVWILVVLCLSTLAVWSGIAEVRHQHKTIDRLLIADQQDRSAELTRQSDWGSAAYYSFHLTYDPPSDFAFAAIGQREALPWKHRLRMLALEGQIYEHDAGNAELALIGRFDFAFFAAFVLPLILIFLLHDLKASERVAGRLDLLNATSGTDGSLWRWRAMLRSAGVLFAALAPLAIASVLSGTALSTLVGAMALVSAYVVFWAVVCLAFASWERSAPVILAGLVGSWILLGTILPTGSRIVVDRLVQIPSGADILMTQREAVNDAWDLPVGDTMTPFVERHPEWTGYAQTGEGFDWPWYYAFQQVGDQKTEHLSVAYQKGRLERDRLAGLIALIAPPALLERQLQQLAATDMRSAIEYENRVRAFHGELRSFFYPMLFQEQAFDQNKLAELPQFNPGK